VKTTGGLTGEPEMAWGKYGVGRGNPEDRKRLKLIKESKWEK
jgi:hypothetical protein